MLLASGDDLFSCCRGEADFCEVVPPLFGGVDGVESTDGNVCSAGLAVGE